VKDSIVSAATNKFKGGNYIGTLKNGGVASRPSTSSRTSA